MSHEVKFTESQLAFCKNEVQYRKQQSAFLVVRVSIINEIFQLYICIYIHMQVQDHDVINMYFLLWGSDF